MGSFRIGECSDSESEVFSAFSEASHLFETLELKNLASKAKGEMAVGLYKDGNHEGFVNIIEELANGYYLKKFLEYGPAVAIGLACVTRLKTELKGKVVELDEKRFPNIKKGIFLSLPEDIKPNPGLCSAFYNLGEAYEMLNKNDRSGICFQQAFEAKPNTEQDVFANISAGIHLMIGLLVKEDYGSLANAAKKVLTSIEPTGRVSDELCAFMIFQKNEECLLRGILSKPSQWKLLESLELATQTLPHERRFWWLAEIYKRKEGTNSVTREANLRKSWEYAISGSNFKILTEVGHQLGFILYRVSKSIKDLAEIQLSIVLGICNDQGSVERLETLGNNLVNFRRGMEYRRLAESDLPYLANLRDRAKRLEKEHHPTTLQSPLMVLFLLAVTGNFQNEKYKKALDWAFGKLEGKWEKISEEDRSYVKDRL